MTKLIVNCETGETTERELNKAELDQQKLDEVEALKQKSILDERIAAKATLLKKLGITEAEARLLLA